MPHPATGKFTEVGAALPGFIPPLGPSPLAGDLEQLVQKARERVNANASTVLQALQGSDPLLYPLTSTVRPKVLGLLRRQATEWATIRAHPERQFMNAAGIARQEQEVRQQHAQELADLQAELTGKLEAITARLQDKLDALLADEADEADWRAANEFADRLTRLGPEVGLDELVAFVEQAGMEERSRGELRALVPILHAGYRHAGGPWAGRSELAVVIEVAESLLDGGATASILQARLERATQAAGSLKMVFMDPAMLNATVTGSGFQRGHGEYALFPDEPQPLGPAVEDKETHDASLRAAWERELQASRDALEASQEP